jgi:hypothetical protein
LAIEASKIEKAKGQGENKCLKKDFSRTIRKITKYVTFVSRECQKEKKKRKEQKKYLKKE